MEFFVKLDLREMGFEDRRLKELTHDYVWW